MPKNMKQEHKDLRKNSLKETRNRRKTQICKSYELKFDKSHLSKEKLDYLNMLFLEAKWLYNSILSLEGVFNFDTKIKTIFVLNKNKEREERKLKYLSSQMKQGIYQRLCNNIKTLSKLKKRGNRIGKLKFKSQINSIPLYQYNCTYKIENDNYIKLQGFNKHFKVIGFEQIPKEAEFASATLIRRQDDYFLHIVCFIPKKEKVFKEDAIGIDFGIKDNLTLSDGEKFKVNVPISERTKKLQRKFKHKIKFSKNWNKLKMLVEKSYRETYNKKKDKRNKIVSYITNTFEKVCFQDESIKEWHENWFGKQIQYSITGGIISDLKTKSHTPIIVNKWFPSTKLCPKCSMLNKIGLDERVYNCTCGYIEDRDIHSARNILSEGLKQIGMEYINTIPVEINTSRLVISSPSIIYEAGSLCTSVVGNSQKI